MYKFQDLCIGDLFNTKIARWVKVSANEAICVMSAVVGLGSIDYFKADEDVIVLYSAILNYNEVT